MKKDRYIRRIIKLVSISFSLVWIQLVVSQNQISFRQLSVKEGLSQNSAISIVQDSIGYLWIATQDGLNKYDGRKFTVYPFKFLDVTRTSYSNLGKVYKDRQGGLWTIPIDKKLYKLNPQKNSFENLPGFEDVSLIFQDEELIYWVGTYSRGLYQYDPKIGLPKNVLSKKETNGPIYNISSDQNGNIVMVTNGLLIEFNKKSQSFSRLSFKDYDGENINENFSDITIDDNGVHWISTFGDGLYYRENEAKVLRRISNLPFIDPLPSNLNILDIHLDKKGRLWLATYGRGLYLLDFEKNAISHFSADKNNPKAVHYNDILCIYEDYSGTLWFGTDGGGISYFDEYLEKFNSLSNYQTPEGISIDVVRSLATDKNGSVWIGTSGKGLTHYEPSTNSWSTFTKSSFSQNSISSDRIMCLLFDEDDDLWIGTQGAGLNVRKTNGKFLEFNQTTKIALSANTVWDIFMDTQQQIWLATRDQGLIQFDKNKGEIAKFMANPSDENSLPGNNIRVITEDKEGNLWIGTEENGIVRFNSKTKSFQRFGQSNGNILFNNGIKSLYSSPSGIIWVGTNGGGLNAFNTNNQNINQFTTNDGLANNVIYAILPDKNGNLWLSSNKGITKFTPNQNLSMSPSIINYSNYDGLATEFNTGAYHIDKEGTLYFGGLDGFYWFHPKNIRENRILPKTSITDFQVFDESKPLVSGTKLNYKQNTLSFSFSSLQYSLPEKNEYQYRLLNYDEDWVYAGNTNSARYTQLPPGEYVFEVKSSNYDGVWNEQPKRFGFTINAPWYFTPLAKVIYTLLFMTALLGVYGYLKWRWKMKLDLQLKEEETQRLKKLNDFKSKLYTDISHEFRTPLTLISGPVDAKLGEGSLSDADFDNFSMIKQNTNRLIKLVDQLLHLAKLEKGKLQLKVAQGNLRLFLGVIASSFKYRAERNGIIFKTNIKNLEKVWYDEDAIEKIVTNLLSNAIKYCPKGGKCQFTAKKEGDRVYLNVENSIEESSEIELEKLFTRFYQQNEYAEGAGVGLSLVKELVHLYRGEVSVQLEDVHVIHFKVNLPGDKALFKKSEFIDKEIEAVKPAMVVVSDSKGLQSDSVPIMDKKEELPIILVVEDHKEVRDFLKSVWKYKYQMYEAENGKLGIEKALEIVPDLIITDVRMPVCDGIVLCNTLKTDERTSHIPIVLLTAGMGEEDELKGLQSGADDFITKPFKLRILEKRVENLIATRKALRGRYRQELILKAKDIAITPTDEVFLNRLQKTLDDNLSNPQCNAAFFCKELGMSRMQLHRKLLAFTGLSTTAFLRSQRLKQAVRLLQTSDASINEVAYEVGFNTPSYFIKCFKEAYKKTPSEYLQTTDK